MQTIPTARELAEFSLTRQKCRTREWTDDIRRLELLARHHELDVALAVDRDIAAVRARRFAPNSSPDRLFNQWVAVTDDLGVMLSIRYENENADRPFVDGTPTSRQLRPSDMTDLAHAATTVFGNLHPRYLRLWSAEPRGWIQDSSPDRRFMAAPLQWLRPGLDHGPPSELQLAPAESLKDYARAQAAYRAVDANHPHHRNQAVLQSPTALVETLANGRLFDVLVHGNWAGYVAVTTDESNTLGLPAYVVQELILSSEFRGRAFGPHLTTLLARALPDDDRSVLLGTIHGENRGALQAATLAGRIDIGGWFRVPLRLPG